MNRGKFDAILLNVNRYISCFMCRRIARTTTQDFSKPINITRLGAIDQEANGIIELSARIFSPLHYPIFTYFDDGIFDYIATSIEATTLENRNDPSLGFKYAISHTAFVSVIYFSNGFKLAHMEFSLPNPIFGFYLQGQLPILFWGDQKFSIFALNLSVKNLITVIRVNFCGNLIDLDGLILPSDNGNWVVYTGI